MPGSVGARELAQAQVERTFAAMPDGSCVVLLSGGQDSTTCLAWALSRFARVETVTIDYGQRHRVELDCAAAIARAAGVPQQVVPCDSFAALGGSTLVRDGSQDTARSAQHGLPPSFVPGRNLVFLTLAAAYGWQRGIHDLVTGVCQTDYSGYPDCRQDTMEALQVAISAGMDASFTIHTPLMRLTKAQTVTMIRDLGRLDWLAWSHTCYEGSRPPCGACPACRLRAKGFAEAGIRDPLVGA